MDNEIAIDYTFKIDGDKLKGKGAADFGGRSRSSISKASGRRRISNRF